MQFKKFNFWRYIKNKLLITRKTRGGEPPRKINFLFRSFLGLSLAMRGSVRFTSLLRLFRSFVGLSLSMAFNISLETDLSFLRGFSISSYVLIFSMFCPFCNIFNCVSFISKLLTICLLSLSIQSLCSFLWSLFHFKTSEPLLMFKKY